MDLQGQAALIPTYRSGLRNRGPAAWALAFALLAVYVLLYFTELFAPLARALHLPSKWHAYGVAYSIAMIAGAIFFLRKRGNDRYARVRTLVNVAVQVALALALPLVMQTFAREEFYFSYFWPLKIEYL